MLAAAEPSAVAAEKAEAEAGFHPIFDGQTLKGWHASAQTGHSRARGNKSGGRWVVENGAIVGSQDIPGNGGIFLTDEQFGNYEVVLEMNNDFGPDSGLFLRCDERGTCYQAMIDYHVGGNLMGLYGEGRLGAKPHVRNFTFLDRPDHIKLVTEIKGVQVPVPFPMPLEDWPKFWKHGQWNELRARIVGKRIALQQPVKPVPDHLTLAVTAIKPFPPAAFHCFQEPLQRTAVVGDPVVRVMSTYLLTQQCVLRADRAVPVPPAPLGNALHRPTQTLRSRLPHHNPEAPSRTSPSMGPRRPLCRSPGEAADGREPAESFLSGASGRTGQSAWAKPPAPAAHRPRA
jgi:hypothetical protein